MFNYFSRSVVAAIAFVVFVLYGSPQQTARVLIWVHGTKVLPQVLIDSLKRYQPFNRNYSKPGIVHGAEYEDWSHMHVIYTALSSLDKQLYDHDHCYFFGWNGQLSFAERKQAAQDLADELTVLKKRIEQDENASVKFTIITHSHGGNVALQLPLYDHTRELSVEKLVLLACPVQEYTEALIGNDYFGSVISFFSDADKIQTMDRSKTYEPSYIPIIEAALLNIEKLYKDVASARRVFMVHKDDHIHQAQVKMGGKGIGHAEFIFPRFIKKIPQALTFVLQKPSGHIPIIGL